MGKPFSKCCGSKSDKYKKKNGVGKAKQPEQDESKIEVVINNGATQDATNTNNKMKTSDNDKDRKPDPGDGTKRTAKDKKRKPKYDSSDDTTTSSSDSDSSIGHIKTNNKVIRNKGGGTTYISKKTIITGSKMTIGENARNLTINIGSSNNEQKLTPFQTYYDESSAREEENRQYTSPWGQTAAPPGGNFIDTRDHNVKEYIYENSVMMDAARWVCKIHFLGGYATGFRVGSKYIMTCNHVLQHILNTDYPSVTSHSQDSTSNLQHDDVYAVFDFLTDGHISERQKFRFKAVVHFSDQATDTAVLELDDHHIGTVPFPLSFTYFSLPKLNDRFSLIGHPDGERMQKNDVDKILDLNSRQICADIIKAKQFSLAHAGKDYEFGEHSKLSNTNRFLFHCKFTKGASGSPGVVVLEDGRVVVVTMLLCGYPDWFYGNTVPDHIKETLPTAYRVEQGVNFKSVYERMFRSNPQISREIFSDHTDSIPDPRSNSLPTPNIGN